MSFKTNAMQGMPEAAQTMTYQAPHSQLNTDLGI
jgi:hypothetical protein